MDLSSDSGWFENSMTSLSLEPSTLGERDGSFGTGFLRKACLVLSPTGIIPIVATSYRTRAQVEDGYRQLPYFAQVPPTADVLVSKT